MQRGVRVYASVASSAGLLALSLGASVASSAAQEGPPEALVKQGEYLFHAAGCRGCHTEDKPDAPVLAGGRRLETPFGIFYGPNITPHREHGIGRWSDADFIRALRTGVSPNGAHYYPAFPYPSYTLLTDDDMRALKAYIFTLPPVAQPSKAHALTWYIRFRPAIRLWKARYFTPGPFVSNPEKTPQWNRGAYLARAAAHCGECHTPRDRVGNPRADLYYAGTTTGPDGAVVPNITPDKKTGIGRWRQSDLAYYLETGMTPDGDFAGDAMAEVVDGLKHLTPDDLRAIASYVFSLPPIEHAVKRQSKRKKDDFGF